jgi:hypothetical protein
MQWPRICVLCRLALSQTVTGTITGTVRDPQGAVVPGATVTTINTGGYILTSKWRTEYLITNFDG